MYDINTFDLNVKNPSEVLWHLSPPTLFEKWKEIGEAYKFLDGFYETFSKWSKNVTNFFESEVNCTQEWNSFRMRITPEMEKVFLVAQNFFENSAGLKEEFPSNIISAEDLPTEL